jgi:hypothetical protein
MAHVFGKDERKPRARSHLEVVRRRRCPGGRRTRTGPGEIVPRFDAGRYVELLRAVGEGERLRKTRVDLVIELALSLPRLHLPTTSKSPPYPVFFINLPSTLSEYAWTIPNRGEEGRNASDRVRPNGGTRGARGLSKDSDWVQAGERGAFWTAVVVSPLQPSVDAPRVRSEWW